ncbi:hypothetical protein [Bradyrhizobium genosp. SA-3]|uniref:hypothetical protein n=1 Tax=Bradyrhizobium genosp. SA-3 TaxID=508868 RepID=UPI0013EE851A|nr:hypothetical protein [Bradyrhizobium genosp. SA-3]
MAIPSRDKAAIIEAMKDTFPPQFRGFARIALQQSKANTKLAKLGASCVAWITFKQNEEEAR